MSALGGVQGFIRKDFPYAFYVHCGPHAFNLSISKACGDITVKGDLMCFYFAFSFGIIVWCNFSFPFYHKCNRELFRESAKRTVLFENAIKVACPDSKRKKLLKLCTTRWSERSNSIESFVELLPAVYIALTNIIMGKEIEGEKITFTGDVIAQAHGFVRSISDQKFIFALALMEAVFSIFGPTSDILQKISIDLSQVIYCYNL